jgi:hypothetical protein
MKDAAGTFIYPGRLVDLNREPNTTAYQLAGGKPDLVVFVSPGTPML